MKKKQTLTKQNLLNIKGGILGIWINNSEEPRIPMSTDNPNDPDPTKGGSSQNPPDRV